MKSKFISFLLFIALSVILVQAAESIYEIALKDIDGKSATLKPYQGKVLLIVNVASRCGHTPQYAGLEALYKKYRDKGLVVCGFPCNQFGGQEPGSEAEIRKFCSETYAVTFPMFSKLDVNGKDRHPLYTFLAGKDSPFSGDIKWNFTKFLVGKDGKVLGRFDSRVKPEADEIAKAIEAAIAAK